MNTATVEVHDLPAGVQGLIQLGRNAIDRVSELERGIAYRDQMIRQLSEELDDLIKTDETIRQLRARLADRIAALEAEKAERERQEPVAWVLFDDIFIAPKDMQDDPPNLECMKPLYAHPLAMREPTEDECRRIANEFLILGGPDELAGRVMFNAVREVMTK